MRLILINSEETRLVNHCEGGGRDDSVDCMRSELVRRAHVVLTVERNYGPVALT